MSNARHSARRRSESAIVAVLLEVYVNRVLTHDLQGPVTLLLPDTTRDNRDKASFPLGVSSPPADSLLGSTPDRVDGN